MSDYNEYGYREVKYEEPKTDNTYEESENPAISYFEETRKKREKKKRSPIARFFLFLFKLWVIAHILIITVVIVGINGIKKATETGEDNFVTEIVLKFFEKYGDEEIPKGTSVAKVLRLQDKIETNTEVRDFSQNDTDVCYLSLIVPDENSFNIMENMDYVTFDIFEKKLVLVVTDERITLSGITSYNPRQITVMVSIDKAGFTEDGVYKEDQALAVLYTELDKVLNEWNSIMEDKK